MPDRRQTLLQLLDKVLEAAEHFGNPNLGINVNISGSQVTISTDLATRGSSTRSSLTVPAPGQGRRPEASMTMTGPGIDAARAILAQISEEGQGMVRRALQHQSGLKLREFANTVKELMDAGKLVEVGRKLWDPDTYAAYKEEHPGGRPAVRIPVKRGRKAPTRAAAAPETWEAPAPAKRGRRKAARAAAGKSRQGRKAARAAAKPSRGHPRKATSAGKRGRTAKAPRD